MSLKKATKFYIFVMIIAMIIIGEMVIMVNCQRGERPQPNRRNSEFATNIKFKYYDNTGSEIKQSTIEKVDSDVNLKCAKNEKFAIIVHGWQETCDGDWVNQLIDNLIDYRGGCILCMDYSKYAKTDNYFRLVKYFDPITDVLVTELQDLDLLGLHPSNGYLFGFSFGGQVVVEAGRRFGTRRLNEIDVCDMAGPGFDTKGNVDHRLAAKNVQCIHTSRDKGTRFSNNCHQNWKMGNCGNTQPGASRPPNGSHGLCPVYYNIAFSFDFLAIEKPRQCSTKSPIARYWPRGFKMGYREKRKSSVNGDLFAITTKDYPFLPKTNLTLNLNFLTNSENDEHVN